MPGFWAIALPLSSSQGGDEICPSDKGNKSWKSLPKLQGQHFLFSGSFNFKRKKKNRSLFSLPTLCLLRFLGCEHQLRGSQIKSPSLVRIISASLPYQPQLRFTAFFFWKSRQKTLVLAFLIKKLEERERQLKKAEGGAEAQMHWQLKLPFWSQRELRMGAAEGGQEK